MPEQPSLAGPRARLARADTLVAELNTATKAYDAAVPYGKVDDPNPLNRRFAVESVEDVPLFMCSADPLVRSGFPRHFMTGDEYIEMVLSRHELKPHLFSALSTNAIIVPKLKEWAGPWLNHITYVGSLAKGTGVSGTTDTDIFISLKPETPHTLEDIYRRLTIRTTALGWNPKQQNVSLGITYAGAKFDIVPGKLQDGYEYYHSLWKRKAKTWTQTAPQIHINEVKRSFRTLEIRALKIWRKNHGLDFPSFYLELTVMKALKGCSYFNLANNVQRALGYIADNLTTAAIEDPANTNNQVSDQLTLAEKKAIAEQAKKSHDETRWGYTLW